MSFDVGRAESKWVSVQVVLVGIQVDFLRGEREISFQEDSVVACIEVLCSCSFLGELIDVRSVYKRSPSACKFTDEPLTE